VALACAAVALPAAADDASIRVGDEAVVRTLTFLDGHPDLKWRRHGEQALARGHDADAYRLFQLAARHADKPSQAMVAELLWEGRGVRANRPLAYAWMDLAAERGHPDFLVLRERYWHALDMEQQRRALALGPAVFAEYADDVAQPRQALAMARQRRSITGSRLGWTGFLRVQPRTQQGWLAPIDGAVLFDKKFWDPGMYWQWQEQVQSPPGQGVIDVLPLRTDEPADDEP
jgi:hypothetical protein